jgi:hypothetical protein
MKITKAAKHRANLALLILAGGPIDGMENNRDYDNCFESGDGTMVVCEIMRQAKKSRHIMDVLTRYPAYKYVDLPGWTKTYKENFPQGPKSKGKK